jgi:hypothetical protein
MKYPDQAKEFLFQKKRFEENVHVHISKGGPYSIHWNNACVVLACDSVLQPRLFKGTSTAWSLL